MYNNDIFTYSDLLTSLSQSKFTSIGIDSGSEGWKYKIINDLNLIHLGKIDNSFNIESFIRESRIDGILDGSKVQNSFYFQIDDVEVERNTRSISTGTAMILRSFTRRLNYSLKEGQRVVFFTNIYDSLDRAGAQRQGSGDRFRGGSSVLYEANIALTIKDNKVTFVKNRYMDVNILNKIELDPSQITDKDIYKPKI